MRYPKYLVSFCLISFLIISVDQMWKYIMINMLTYGESIPIIKGVFSLTLVFNTGAVFGVLPGKQDLFLILPGLTIILVLFLYLKSKNKQSLVLPLACLMSGTIGNFIDRVRLGYVIDFFDLYWHTFHWPAFNFADASICIGVVLLVRQMIIQKPETSPRPEGSGPRGVQKPETTPPKVA